MIEDPLGCLEYDESGRGRTIVFVPGSCSTGAAWRPVIASLGSDYRIITTALPGYGRSAERRTAADRSIGLIATAIETVIRYAGTPVHLVGHSFGGEVGLAIALRGRVRLDSLTILEAPAPNILRAFGRSERYEEFRAMTDAYVADFCRGNAEAIGRMIDFYGGCGTFASWPETVRAHVSKTTPTNILDWESAYAIDYDRDALARLNLSVLVAVGGGSHPAVQEANRLLARALPDATYTTVEGASHFMIATHPHEVTSLIIQHISS
jgi:pimeloyl-ACP methyl ester carboxylesterase